MKPKVRKYLKLLIILLLFTFYVYSNVYAQKALGTKNDIIQTRELDEFNSLIFDGDMNIHIFQGDINNVVIVGDRDLVNKIQTNVSDKILKIYSYEVKKMDDFLINISVKDLKAIDITGDVNITVETPANFDELEIYLSNEWSTLNLDITGEKLNCNISGIGVVEITSSVEYMNVSVTENIAAKLHVNSMTVRSKVDWMAEASFEGKTDLLDLYVSNLGYVNAFNLNSNTCYVNTEENSDVSVSCSKKLSVTGNGKSYIYYQGEPEDKYVNLSGSAKIKKKSGLFAVLR